MFGRKKDKNAAGAKGTMTGEDVERALAEQAAAAGALTEDQEVEEAFALAASGTRARATMTAVESAGQSEFGAVWRMKMTVQVTAEDAFDAEIALVYMGFEEVDFAPWKVGDVAPVVFDPQNRSRVRFLPPGLQAAVRWRLPEKCPQCGAPVDQATESLIDPPSCRFCNQPLPAEPLA
jgi:hypothetical protein